MGSGAIHRVSTGLVTAAVLLFAIGQASAQTTSPAAAGPCRANNREGGAAAAASRAAAGAGHQA